MKNERKKAVTKPVEQGQQLSLSFISSSIKQNTKQDDKQTPVLFPNLMVQEPNKLLELTKSYTILERRLYLLVLREIKSIQEINPEFLQPFTSLSFQFHYSEIRKAHSNGSLRQMIERIQHKGITWTDEKGNRFKRVVIFPVAEYIINQGIIRLEMHHQVIPLFLNLSQGYTTYQLEIALGLTSQFATVVYPYVARYKNTGFWTVTVDEFRRITECENKYPNFAHLKRCVIDPTIKQINESTDFKVRCSHRSSRGRAITSIRFDIAYKDEFKPKEIGHAPARQNRITKEEIPAEFERIKRFDNRTAKEYLDAALLCYPKLSDAQKNQIYSNLNMTLAFLWADLYVQEGSIKNPDAYIAESVFHYKDAPEQLVMELQPLPKP